MEVKKNSWWRTERTVALYNGGSLRIGSALLPENGHNLMANGELRFKVEWRGSSLYLTPVRSGGVVAFVTSPYAKSPRVSVASALKMQGVDWRVLPKGNRPATRRGKAIVVDFGAENGHKA